MSQQQATPPAQGGAPQGQQEPGTPPATPPAGQEGQQGTPPATPPKVEPKPAPKIDETVTNQVNSMVKDAGLDPQQVAKIMAEDGMTPAIYSALAEKHGEGVATLLKGQMENLVTSGKEQATARDQAVYDQVAEEFKGITEQTGQETWTELSTWAKANIEDADRKEINKLLNQGGMAAKLAVQELVTAFKNSDGYEQPANLVTGDGVSDMGTGKPLSRQEYHSELDKLLAKGHVYGQSAEIAQLDRRRSQSLRRGQ